MATASLSQNASSTAVLVTGGTGFVANYLILDFLKAGYTVRTTLRSHTPARTSQLQILLSSAGATPEELSRLSFFQADLTSDDGWSEAIAGCTYVHHVASPFPSGTPKNEDELILPAREGTLRVLRAAKEAGVTRVIMTSSFATIGYAQSHHTGLFTEQNWSPVDGKEGAALPAYHKSKILAERAAWEFIKNQSTADNREGKQGESQPPNNNGHTLELTVLNPTGIFGPVLSATHFTASILVLKRLLDGTLASGCPKLSFSMVDVRDLSALHVIAMTHPAAKNERFIAVGNGEPVSLLDIAQVVRRDRPELVQEKEKDGKWKLPKREVPNLVMRALALFNAEAKSTVPQLGVVRRVGNEKAKRVLGWKARSIEEIIIETVDSLVEFGVV